MIYLSNAFSLQMAGGVISERTTLREVSDLLHSRSGYRSVVGHADTARILSEILGVAVDFNREMIKIGPDDLLIVGQYVGGRLPEGATSLPVGGTIDWFFVARSPFLTIREAYRIFDNLPPPELPVEAHE